MKIYVASSWRNIRQPDIVCALRSHGYEVYDFRHPAEGNNGFQWSEIDPEWGNWDAAQLIDGLSSSVADTAFGFDFEAMKDCDAAVLVLPCGKSAHLELGWFVGVGKPTWILLEDRPEPELMYKMATSIVPDLDHLLSALRKH